MCHKLRTVLENREVSGYSSLIIGYVLISGTLRMSIYIMEPVHQSHAAGPIYETTQCAEHINA